jgi:hypothetical protein
MPTIQDVRPGGRIVNDYGENGTLTCFARRTGQQHVLYGITAKHVIESGQGCWLEDHWTVQSAIQVGSQATHVAGLDALYFEIENGVRTQLIEANFHPLGYAFAPMQVWNPSKHIGKVNSATSSAAADQLKQKEMAVDVVGSTQAAAGNPISAGQLVKYSKEINSTRIAPGDSGGCVIDRKSSRYVALISGGNQKTQTNSGHVVLIQEVFDRTGLVLATWADRSEWL